MEGKIEGTRYSGKQRRTWTSDVMDWCGMSYTKCVSDGKQKGMDFHGGQHSLKKMALSSLMSEYLQ